MGEKLLQTPDIHIHIHNVGLVGLSILFWALMYSAFRHWTAKREEKRGKKKKKKKDLATAQKA